MAQRIGDFLVESGALTPAQAEEIVKIQKSGTDPRPFGEIAVGLGYVSEAVVKKFFEVK